MLLHRQTLPVLTSTLMLARADGTPIDRPLDRALWRDIEKTWPVEFGLAETPWPGGETQVTMAWPSDPATWSPAIPLTFPNRSGAYVHSVEFRDHPLGDRTAQTIAVTACGKVE
jgi:hypothetical protein